MGIFDRPKKALADLVGKELEPTIAKSIVQAMQATDGPALLRKDNLYSLSTTGLRRYQQNYNTQDLNTRRKPQSAVGFEILRQFSTTHEISRACINLRKREITQLEWDIIPADPEDKTDYTKEIKLVSEYFKNLGGYKTRFRSVLDQLIEDLLALDAISLYRQRTVGGQPLYYIPIDPATIKLRLDEFGNTPEPPEIAYKQIVRGELVAELTTDELIYDMLNSRSNTPYGLAPLESLIIIVSTNLKSNLYNLNYLTDGNIPEGLFAVPPDWSPQQIREYQEVWDAYLAGDTRATSRMRFVPGGPGTSYMPTKKPTDMQFEQLNEYIMKVTCALFDVSPQEIGFTDHSSTRANASEQSIIQQRKGTLPLANFLKELFTDIIQHDLGIDYLAFDFLGLEDHDAVAEATARQTDIFSGVRTIDEFRVELGLEPLGIDRPFVTGQITALDATLSPEAIKASVEALNPQPEPQPTTQDNPNQDKQPNPKMGQPTEVASQTKSADALDDELRKLRKYATGRKKDGKSLRPFASEVLPSPMVDEINKRLTEADTVETVKQIIDEYRQSDKLHTVVEKAVDRNQVLDAVQATPDFRRFQKSLAGGISQQASAVASQLRGNHDVQTVEHPDMVSGFVGKHMPKLASLVSKQSVTDYFKTAFNHAVKERYRSKGFTVKGMMVKADVNFDITNPYYLAQLQQQTDYLLNQSSIDPTTRDRIIQIIQDGKAAGLNNDEIASEIDSQFTDISKSRADMIARTETANVASQADLAAAKENGVQTKVWVVAGPGGDECDDNEAQGPIGISEAFATGDDAPPAHPNCECYVDWGEVDLSALADNLWDGE